MLTTLLVVIAALAVVFCIMVARRPADFRIVRSATVSAPAVVVFAQVNKLSKWEAWSPWAKLDPNMKQSYDGPPSGVGSVLAWVGNKKVGEGRMTITESRPDSRIALKLEFLKPFACTNTSEFTFMPEGVRTVVTWSMSGQKNFFFKAFSLFMDMDKRVGGDFEKGLASLKSVAEATVQK